MIESRTALQRGFALTGWTVDQLWVAVVGIGGGFGRSDVDWITSGRRAATATEHDMLAIALNEYFAARGEDHPVALWNDLAARREAAT